MRQKSEPVFKIDKNIKKIVEAMKKIMKLNNGLGLAANQIGILKRIFVAEVENKRLVCINPEIITLSGTPQVMEEGCLSIPDQWGEVKRYPEVTIKYTDLWNKTRKLKAKGLLAQVIQHEIDHLDGVLFIDKAIKTYSINQENFINK